VSTAVAWTAAEYSTPRFARPAPESARLF